MPGGWWDSRQILRPSLGSQVCKGSGARVLGWEGQERKPKDKEERSQTVSREQVMLLSQSRDDSRREGGNRRLI